MGLNPFAWIGGKQADKALDIAAKATGGIISGIDALVYTPQEKAELAKQITDAHVKLMATLTGENTSRAITRRILAVIAYSVFFFLIMASFALFKVNPAWAKHAFELAKAITSIILTITFFYYGYYGIVSGMGAWTNKKK